MMMTVVPPVVQPSLGQIALMTGVAVVMPEYTQQQHGMNIEGNKVIQG
jgi:hypothetical protein